MAVAAFLQHRMRAYYLPFAAGAALVVSAFLPWIVHAGMSFGGFPSASGVWIVGLGLAAMLLAGLSVFTRKNSRHPLLVVGLTALAVEFLGWQWMRRAVAEQAWASSHAAAIVAGGRAEAVGRTSMGAGLYIGMIAAIVITLFGLTIVVKTASRPYAAPEDDV